MNPSPPKATIPRDLAIEAAAHSLIRIVDPWISYAAVQERGSIEIHEGAYTLSLDGNPVCHVALDGSKRFTMTLLIP